MLCGKIDLNLIDLKSWLALFDETVCFTMKTVDWLIDTPIKTDEADSILRKGYTPIKTDDRQTAY